MLGRRLQGGRGRLQLLVLSCLAAACSTQPIETRTVPEARSSTGKPTAAAFFRHPVLTGVTLSPDGQRIAAISADGAHERIVVRHLDEPKMKVLAKIKRGDYGLAMTVDWIDWVNNDLLLMSVAQALDGALVDVQRTRLFSATLDGKVEYIARNWLGQEWTYVQGNLVSWLPQDPDGVLFSIRIPGTDYPEVARVDVRTGRRRTVLRPRTSIYSWYADHRGDIRVGEGVRRPDLKSDTLQWLVLGRSNTEEALQEIGRWGLQDDGFEFAGFSDRAQLIYVYETAPTDRQQTRVRTYDLEKRSLGEVVFEHPEVDPNDLVRPRYAPSPEYIAYTTERPTKHFLDPEAERRQRRIDAALPNRTNLLISESADRSRSIVLSSSDVVPPEYYLFDGKQLGLLAHAYPELVGATLAPMKPVQYAARDGLTIHGYLTRPVDAPDGAIPTIVVPHGGPWARDVWGWDPIVQFFASRGFAVFQPNFRGSTGYGATFERAGYGEFGLAMQDDITDGVKWLIAEGLADPERIGIFGWSYGGYAALQGLASTPELYRAGASYAGVYDLRAWMSEVNLRLIDDSVMKRVVGNRRSDKAKLLASSPTHNAGKIRAPVLLGHGTRDESVAVEQAKAMERALRRADAPVEVYIYQDELHDFLDDRNQIHFFTKAGDFFEQHLLGDG